ncbi:MAG: phage portal protein family protein [Oscillospiraceae bacterium]
MANNNFREIGRLGQKRYGGFFYEEFLKDLQGRKGVEVYREMSENDDVIGAILYAIEMLIRQASWTVQPGGPTTKDEEATEFIYQCMDDMQDTWTDTISEILSFLTYGWSAHEIVYKRRAGKSKDPRLNSKYSDGLIGWRKLPIRAQETLWEWVYDEGG